MDTKERPNVFIPSRGWIESLKEGDMAPDCFGDQSRVMEIFARREDITGRLFVCYRTQFGTNSTLSMYQKEGEVSRDFKTTQAYTSAELDAMETA